MLSILASGSQHLTTLPSPLCPNRVEFNLGRVCAYGWLDTNRPQYESYHKSYRESASCPKPSVAPRRSFPNQLRHLNTRTDVTPFCEQMSVHKDKA